MMKHLKAHELKSLVKKGAILVDVRESDEQTGNSIDGSINWPLSKLNDQKTNISKTRPTIFYCSSGLRSQKAAEIVQEWTNQDIYTLDGGILEYSSK